MPGLDHLRAAGERVSQSVRTRADLHTAVACGPGVRSSAAKIARRAVSTRFIWLCVQTIVLLVSAASRAAAGGKAGGARRAAGGTQGAAACQRRLSARSPRRRSPALPPASSGTVALPARGSASGCTAPALPACWRRGGRHPATATARPPPAAIPRIGSARPAAGNLPDRAIEASSKRVDGCRCAAAGVELWTSTRARPASTRRVQSLPLALWQARRGGHVQRRDFQLPSADGRGC